MYTDDCWTTCADAKIDEIVRDFRLQAFGPKIYEGSRQFTHKASALEIPPPVFTHKGLCHRISLLMKQDPLRVQSIGRKGGVEAFGMVVFALYGCFVKNRERDHWYSYDIRTGYQYRDHRSGKVYLTRLQHSLTYDPFPSILPNREQSYGSVEKEC